MMNANRTLKLTTLALCGVINILGGTIALLLRLPVYLDSIGTVLAAALFGPAAGLVPGLISGLISGMTSDVYAFYYIPVQLVIGLVAGLVFRRLRPSHTAGSRSESLSLRSMGWKLFPAALVITSGYCGKFHNHRGCFRWNYFLRLHCAGAAASQPRYESDSLCLRCTGHDRLCGSNDCPCGRPRDSARRFFCFRQSFHEKQKIICTNSTKNPAKNSLSFLQDSHILA